MTTDWPSTSRRWPRLLAGLLLVSAGASLLLGWWGVTPDRLLALAQEQREALVRLSEQSPFAPLLFFLSYVAFTSLSLPGALFLSILAGALFSFPLALLLVSFASALGGTFAFLSARYLLRDGVQRRYGDRLPALQQELARAGGFYLLSLRLNPLVPYVVINLLFGLTTMPVWKFWVVTQIGMIPVTSLYLLVGRQLATVHSVADIFTPEVLGVLLVISLVPLAARGLLAWRQRRKAAATHPQWGRPVRCLLVASLACGIIWWQWPYVPDEVRTPPDAGWFSGVSEVTFSHDGEWALSRHGQEAWIWRLADQQCVRKISVTPDANVWFCPHPAWVKAAWKGGRGDFAAWHVPTGTKIRLHGRFTFRQSTLSHGQSHGVPNWGLDLVTEDGEAIIWNLITGESRHMALPGLDPQQQLVWLSTSSDGRFVITKRDAGKDYFAPMVLLDLQLGQALPVPSVATDKVVACFISPSGRFVAWLTEQMELMLWDRTTETPRQLRAFLPSTAPSSLLFTPNEERLVASKGESRRVLQWKLPSGDAEPEFTLPSERSPFLLSLFWIPQTKYWVSTQVGRQEVLFKVEMQLAKWGLALPDEFRVWYRTLLWEEGRAEPIGEMPFRFPFGVTKDGRMLAASGDRLQIWSLPPRRPWLLSLGWALGLGLGWWLLEAGVAGWRRTAPPPAAVR